MAEVITCIEHEILNVVETRVTGQKALGQKHVELLAKMILPANTFSWGHKSIKWKHYCGVIQLGDVTLEILPKIYGKENMPESCRAALIRMLKKARIIKTHKGSQSNINIQRHTLLDIFILGFCDELQIQLLQGKIRQYKVVDENLPVLRGKLLIREHLKHNLSHRERLYCQYDELNDDILLNQIIKLTLKLLLPQTRSGVASKAVSDCLMSFDAISDVLVHLHQFKQLLFDRTNTRYKPVIEQCEMFIAGLSPDVLSGDGKAFSLLFDMNRLFESWIAASLRSEAWRQGYQLREQGPRKYLAYRQDLQRKAFQMRPDITFLDIENNNKVVIIADAKWKVLNEAEIKLGISQADLYQMQSYANRYHVKELYLFYPAQEKLTKRYMLDLHGKHQSHLIVFPVDINGSIELLLHKDSLV